METRNGPVGHEARWVRRGSGAGRRLFSARAALRRGVAAEQGPRLLEPRNLSINFHQNIFNFHVIYPFVILRFIRSNLDEFTHIPFALRILILAVVDNMFAIRVHNTVLGMRQVRPC